MMATDVSIPKRAVFKPAEVCSIAGVQPYILRSWEAEFPTLARAKKKGDARVYRRGDVEMVLQIKTLVFGEGLTLGAARRKLDAETAPPPEVDDDTLLVGLFDSDTRDRISGVKQGLRDILALLSSNGQSASAPAATKSGEAVTRAAKSPGRSTKPKVATKTVKAAKVAKASKVERAVKGAKTTKAAKPRKVVKRKRSA